MEINKLFKTMMAGAMALSLAACSSSSDTTTTTDTTDSGDTTTTDTTSTEGEVSVFYYTFNDDYISSVRSALDADFEAAGIAYNNYDGNNSQTTQTEQIETAIGKGSKCLVVNLVDTGSDSATEEIISKAETAGIPVIFFNRSVSEEVVSAYDKAAFVGTDYEQAGHMQGELIGEYLVENFDTVDLNGDGVISYMMLKGQEGNAEADARTQYSVEDANKVLEEAGKEDLVYYDANANTQYLLDKDGAWSSEQGNALTQTVLSQYTTANGNMVELVIANNDGMAMGAVSALQNEGYNTDGAEITIPVFGVDALPEAVTKIEAGEMTGTIKQDGEGMAAAICTMVENLTSGKDKFEGLDADNVVGTWRINIPYSVVK